MLRFEADAGERELRWSEARIGFAVAAALLVPGAVCLLAAGVLAVLGSSSALPAAQLAFMFLNPVVLLFPVALAARSWQVMRGLTTRAVLEPGHVSLPASGTRGVYALGLEDGYRYVPGKRVLQIRVPYGRIRDVRRVTDPGEQARLVDRTFHRTVRAKAGGVVLRQTVRGHVLVGAGAGTGAPALFEEELRTSLVTDPSAAVAITFHELRRDSQLYGHLPERAVGATVYVSVADPDALVLELSTRVAAAEPLVASPVAPPPLPDGPPPLPDVPPRPLAPPRAPRAGPSELETWLRDARTWAGTPVGRRVVDLGTGIAWWTVASGVAFVGMLAGATVVTAAAAGPYLLRDATIVVLFVALGSAGALYVPWPLGAALIDLVGLLLGFRPLWRRVVLTALLLLGCLPSWWWAADIGSGVRGPPIVIGPSPTAPAPAP